MELTEKDYLYENPPLVEVIAELHWNLKQVQSLPNAKIDPFYEIFETDFVEKSVRNSLNDIQEIIPAEVPLELIANQPRRRLRSKENEWPLVQIGPGIMTCNIVPPYEGWRDFEPFLAAQVRRLFETYPLSDKTLEIRKLHLRYIDGFDERFGFRSFAEFAESMLGVPIPLKQSFIDQNVQEGTDFSYLLQSNFDCAEPIDTKGLLKLVPGKLGENDALIMEMHCERHIRKGSELAIERILEWFNRAHYSLKQQFESLISDDLRSLMGNVKELDQ